VCARIRSFVLRRILIRSDVMQRRRSDRRGSSG
jgi:hypothetical protein